MKTKLLPLLNQIGEIYQDIEVKGELLFKGVRDCAGRWEMIKPHIKPNSVVLDLGSSFGYFAIKIAKEFPTTLILSFERDRNTAFLQKELLKAEGLTNVILLNHSLSFLDLRWWLQTVEAIDTIVAMSVLHNYAPEEIQNILKLTNLLSPEIILEMPNENELKATGHETVMALSPLEQTLKNIYQDVKKLGEIKSHVQDTFRMVYRASDIVKRGGLVSYRGCPEGQKLHTLKYDNKEWQIDNKKHLIAGINVWNLLYFKIIYPESDWWYKRAEEAYKKIIDSEEKVSDVRPWNLLVTSDGLTAIDYKFPVPEGHPMAYVPEHLKKTLSIFQQMVPKNWDTL